MQRTSLEFRLLGPLEVRAAGGALRLGGARQRRLLAGLLLRANRRVSVERLVDLLWDEDPPATASAQVRRRVWELRKLLAEVGADRAVVTFPLGYLLRVEPGQLDLEVFERTAARGRQARADGLLEQAGEELRAALALWHGPALDGVGGARLAAERARLDERRLAVLEERIEVDLALGRHGDLVAELSALVAEHPLRERLRGQLMRALHGAGRQAEALEVYQDARRALRDELGLEPGAELRQLQQAILNGALPAPPATPATAGGAVRLPVPAQLPPDLPDFTGRTAQLRHVCEALSGRSHPHSGSAPNLASATRVATVAGPAGVGKTALAVHAAHRLRRHFPDGQLYVNLQGVQPRPVPPEETLASFLRALGVAGRAIPPGLDERAGLYRSLLADRRVLVLLDNAASHAQVRPLLPGGAGCGVLVTSRVRLTGLEGAALLDLDVLDEDEAVAVLAAVAGPERVRADPDAAAAVARACGHLPLALRIAGARLAARPDGSVRTLAGRLSGQHRRLDELATGDLEVRSSIALSYQGLDEAAGRAFRLLGLLDAPEFAAWVTAALLDTDLATAERLVACLAEAQLLQTAADAAGEPRYRFHDLLRLYARERAEAEEAAGERHAALERALGAWLALAERAGARLPVWVRLLERGHARRWQLDEAAAGAFTADPAGWLETERAALRAAVAQAAATPGLHTLAWALASALTRFFELRSLWDDWERTHQAALDAAVGAGDRRGEATMRYTLAELALSRDRCEEALAALKRVAELFAEVDDRRGQAYALYSTATARRATGRHDGALAALKQAAALFAELGDRPGQAQTLHRIGAVLLDRGDADGARPRLEQALELFERLGSFRSQAQVLRHLGMLHQAQGRTGAARDRLAQALAILGRIGDPLGEAYCRQSLGELHLRSGRPDDAQPLLEQALTDFQKLGDRLGLGSTLRSLGELHHARGHAGRAIPQLQRSLRILREINNPVYLTRTLDSLGTVRAATGDPAGAQAAWHEALGIYRKLGAPEAADLQARLARVATGQPSAAVRRGGDAAR